MQNKLNKRFHKIYEDRFIEMNSNVITPDSIENGIYRLRYPTLSENSGITKAKASQDAFSLTLPAVVKDTYVEGLGVHVVQRILMPKKVCNNLMEKNELVFKSYFDKILKQALSRFEREVGFSYKDVSVGKWYCNYLQPGTVHDVFREVENGMGYELRLYGDALLLDSMEKVFVEDEKNDNISS